MDYGRFYSSDDCDLAAFRALTERETPLAQVPLAATMAGQIPIYDADGIRSRLEGQGRQAVLQEFAWVLGAGPGVFAVRGAVSEAAVIDAATQVYTEIIAKEQAAGQGAGDHFAAAGQNARVWNSAQKLCMAAPEVFARYFGNTILAGVCEAWLGPGYQMTAQVNLVRPGGSAQEAHRDYHLGFAASDAVARCPAHMHALSAALTLQGAIAHCDMPVDSGPTKLLPYSQLFAAGYLAYHRAEFRDFFEESYVQIPLAKGDMLFFNPALFHAAGENRSNDIHRMANLVQVSSPFGRAMETLDRAAMATCLYPAVQALHQAEALSLSEAHAAIDCAAEGYAFPTNLDTDPPLGGRAPQTPAALMREALQNGMAPEDFARAIKALYARRLA